jgi:hypothetical protein
MREKVSATGSVLNRHRTCRKHALKRNKLGEIYERGLG